MDMEETRAQETSDIRDLTVEEIDSVTAGAGFDAKCTHDNWYAEWIYENFKVCI